MKYIALYFVKADRCRDCFNHEFDAPDENEAKKLAKDYISKSINIYERYGNPRVSLEGLTEHRPVSLN